MTIAAAINYLAERPERQSFYLYDRPKSSLRDRTETVTIADARPINGTLSLDREGFRLVEHKSAVQDFRDADAVRDILHAEVARLVEDATGASRVFVTGSIMRFPDKVWGVQEYGRNAHVDYSAKSARKLADMLLEMSEETHRRGQRVIAVNIWRALTCPQDVALAICDAQSVAPGDLVPIDLVWDEPGKGPARRDESLWVGYNPRHRWYYFSDMRVDEVALFKLYDLAPGSNLPVPHSAFDHPACPPGTPRRISIELRAFAFFDD